MNWLGALIELLVSYTIPRGKKSSDHSNYIAYCLGSSVFYSTDAQKSHFEQ